jgi:cholesterol transport system auxiliary component
MKVPLLVGVLLFTSACSLFDSKLPGYSGYVLAPAPAAIPASLPPAVDVFVSVARPRLAAGLDSDRIAVLRGRELTYFSGGRWSAPAADLVQALLVSSLRNQALFRGVAADEVRIASQYLIDIEITGLQAEYTDRAAPSATVGLVGRIVRRRDRTMIATIPIESSVAAASNTMTEVVAAFEAAAQQTALSLATQTAVALAADVPDQVSPAGSQSNVRDASAAVPREL